MTTRSTECDSSAVAAAGPSKTHEPSGDAFDAGPLSDYRSDGVFDAFRDDGFFLVRRDREIIALSSVCTHRGCKVRPQPDGSYLCKCHGSRFDPAGKVVKPPAKRDLPRLKVALDEDKHVLVKLPRPRRASPKGGGHKLE